MYNTKTHGDFKIYFDNRQKRNYWVLGYFGGGSVNISEAYTLAEQFSKEVGVPLETVKIDEILNSRRHKGFKFMYSSQENQTPQKGADKMDNVYAWLTD
jgi:hypothetical protein